MRLRLRLLLFFCAITPCVAQTIDMRTTVRDVVVQANGQQAGSIEFVISGEAFYGASPEQPHYIRISFDKNVLLCKTLVWTSEANPDLITQMPIYLPISFANSDANNAIDFESAGAVSIVRWKAGESSIWLSVVQEAASLTVGPLDQDNRVRFGLGFSARSYWAQNSSSFFRDDANLPSTTRDASDPLVVTQADAVSTLLCQDFRQSTTTASPWNPETQTIGNFNLNLFDANTLGVDGPQAVANEADIIEGDILRTSFRADNPISKGINSTCSTSLSGNGTIIGEGQLCGQGLVSLASNPEIQVSCSNSWGFHVGSEGIITLAEDSQYGFRVQTDGQGAPQEDEQGRVLLFAEDFIFGIDTNPPPLAYCNAADIFLATGDHWLSRQAILVYDGPNTLGGIALSMSATVYQDVAAGIATVLATKQLRIGNRDPLDVLDAPPFDHPQEQHRRCPSGYREVSIPGEFLLGEFTNCGPGGRP